MLSKDFPWFNCIVNFPSDLFSNKNIGTKTSGLIFKINLSNTANQPGLNTLFAMAQRYLIIY